MDIGTSEFNNLTGQLLSPKSHLCNDESPKLQKERIWLQPTSIFTGLEMMTITLDCNAMRLQRLLLYASRKGVRAEGDQIW